MSALEEIEQAIAKLAGMRGTSPKLEGWVAYEDLAIWAIKSSDGSAIGTYFIEEDAEEIVTLHRTIDAQIAILTANRTNVAEYPICDEPGAAEEALALARAILGTSA